MFRREMVIDADDRAVGGICNHAADPIVTVQISDDPAAAMKPDKDGQVRLLRRLHSSMVAHLKLTVCADKGKLSCRGNMRQFRLISRPCAPQTFTHYLHRRRRSRSGQRRHEGSGFRVHFTKRGPERRG
jgi:hypothetical protein